MQPDFTSQKLLIIGNGFDLNLGLKTSYTHFLQSHQFQTLIGQRNMLAEYLRMQQQLQNWIDVEKEIERYSIESEFDRDEDKAFKKEFNELRLMLMDYLKIAQNSKLNHESAAAKTILSLMQHSSWTVLDFNYTDSVELLIKGLDIKMHNKTAYIKIHGSLAKSDIILGVEDDSDIPNEHVFLNKSFSPSYGAVDVYSLMKSARKIEFFGYSFGETDHMYFKDYFNDVLLELTKRQSTDIVSFKYSYYGDDSYQDIYKNLHILTGKNYSGLGKKFRFERQDLSIKKKETTMEPSTN
jgi:hypothetical protein